MGNTPDKEESSKTVGDQTVTIVENQEVHTGFHENHEWKLNIILVLLVIQTAIMVVKTLSLVLRRAFAKAAEKNVSPRRSVIVKQ